jgi:hypothetical protein
LHGLHFTSGHLISGHLISGMQISGTQISGISILMSGILQGLHGLQGAQQSPPYFDVL